VVLDSFARLDELGFGTSIEGSFVRDGAALSRAGLAED
jgi:hypothetical protein